MSLAIYDNHELGRLSSREVGLWATAGTLMLSVHVAAAWYAQRHSALVIPQEQAHSIVMIDLAPMVIATEVTPLDTAYIVDRAPTEEVKEVIEPIKTITLAKTAEPAIEPVQETAEAMQKPVENIIEEPLEEVMPDLVELLLPKVAMIVPIPRSRIEKPKQVEKPVRKKPKVEKKRFVEKSVQETSKQPVQSLHSAIQTTQAHNTTSTLRPGSSAGSKQSLKDCWESRVLAHLQSRGRSMRNAGLTIVDFSVDSNGTVIAVSVNLSSGNPVLDRAAIALIRRASPVPAPPSKIARTSNPVRLPIQFSRR